MIYTFTILNKDGQPIKAATVSFVENTSGNTLATLSVDQSGKRIINTETDSGLFQNTGIVFDAPGYWNYGLSADQVPRDFVVTLEKKTNASVLLGIGAAAAVVLLTIINPKLFK